MKNFPIQDGKEVISGVPSKTSQRIETLLGLFFFDSSLLNDMEVAELVRARRLTYDQATSVIDEGTLTADLYDLSLVYHDE